MKKSTEFSLAIHILFYGLLQNIIDKKLNQGLMYNVHGSWLQINLYSNLPLTIKVFKTNLFSILSCFLMGDYVEKHACIVHTM